MDNIYELKIITMTINELYSERRSVVLVNVKYQLNN